MKNKESVKTQVLNALSNGEKNMTEVAKDTDYHYQTVRNHAYKMADNGDINIKQKGRQKILEKKGLLQKLFGG